MVSGPLALFLTNLLITKASGQYLGSLKGRGVDNAWSALENKSSLSLSCLIQNPCACGKVIFNRKVPMANEQASCVQL